MEFSFKHYYGTDRLFGIKIANFEDGKNTH
jgi:hypothetical protein